MKKYSRFELFSENTGGGCIVTAVVHITTGLTICVNDELAMIYLTEYGKVANLDLLQEQNKISEDFMDILDLQGIDVWKFNRFHPTNNKVSRSILYHFGLWAYDMDQLEEIIYDIAGLEEYEETERASELRYAGAL